MATTKRGVKSTQLITKSSRQESLVNRAQQLVVLSDALTRLGMRGPYGSQYDGERDITKMAGYRSSLSFKDYDALYTRDPVAGAVIDMPAETTWRSPPDIVEVKKPQSLRARVAQLRNRRIYNQRLSTEPESAFTKTWKDLVDRLGVWERLERVDRSARKGQYAVLLLGTTDVAIDSDWMKPLKQFGDRPEHLVYLQAYDENQASVSQWDDDPKSDRFGQPLIYTIQFARSGTKGFGALSGSVHWTRLIHVAEDLTNDDVYGRPVLERLFDDFTNLQKVTASTGEAFWQQVAGVLQAVVENAKDSRPLTDAELKALDKDLQAIYHNLRRTFMGQGVKLERLAGDLIDPTPSATLYMRRIGAGARIPMRLLYGSETGERSSSEDQKTYLGSIEERQVHYAEPRILRPLIDRLHRHALLPKPKAGAYEAVWPELAVESNVENAAANLNRAKAAQALTPAGGDPLMLVEVDENRDVWLVPSTPNKPAREFIEPPDDAEAGAEVEDDEGATDSEDTGRGDLPATA